MARIRLLLEVPVAEREAFALHAARRSAPTAALTAAEGVVDRVAGLGVTITDLPPVPLFAEETVRGTAESAGFRAFAQPTLNDDALGDTLVVGAEVSEFQLDALRGRPGVRVWRNSPLTLYHGPYHAAADCRPFGAPVSVPALRTLLGARAVWADGVYGQGVAVGILDEGVSGLAYPVAGGFARPGALPPGGAAVTSHGSMCAAGVLVAAPAAQLYDYPFLGVPDSGGALVMQQAVLEQRRRDGTPQVTTNSYGFVGVPPRETAPEHEVWDRDHPLNRKVREVVASGTAVFFAAGNCGVPCPSGKCLPSGIGPGRSIHGVNSLAEVVTVAAVNAWGGRIGYSSQGPGMFEARKPDLAAYSHYYGNFGPGRPGGTEVNPFDNGTSAACPLAAGVAALILSAAPGLDPSELKRILVRAARRGAAPWNADVGHGIIDAVAAYRAAVGAVPA